MNLIFDIMKHKRTKYIFLLLFIFSIIFTFFFYNYTLNISGKVCEKSVSSQVDTIVLSKPIVYIGVISRYPANIIFRGYQPILDYLSSKTNYRFELKLRSDYQETVKMLVNKEVTAAFLGSYVYINANKKYGAIPLLKPLNENFEPYSRSVLFTSEKSNIYGINEIKDKRLALPSKESFSVNWLLRYEFKKIGFNENDFSQIKHFPHHQSVIYQVSVGNFDVGVTREYLIKDKANLGLRIILYSEQIPTSPLVIMPDTPKDVAESIKKTLLNINRNNPDRIKITKNWDSEFIYGFEEASDKDYDFIRVLSQR